MPSMYGALPPDATAISDNVGYQWHGEGRSIDDLWVWHDCPQVLGPGSIAPGQPFGWRPTGVRAHTLVQVHPLTLTASVYWPDCRGLHGFITDGQWQPA